MKTFFKNLIKKFFKNDPIIKPGETELDYIPMEEIETIRKKSKVIIHPKVKTTLKKK
jgi:hypothetical protein